MRKTDRLGRLALLAVLVGLCVPATTADARTLLKSICRIKGQEENTLQGLGLVVGLQGTGDGGAFLPTIRSLARAMRVMGEPVGQAGVIELKDAKNVALVTVTATIPATGARQGDKIDCVVSSIGAAKSLAGGRLFVTAMIGPDRNNPRIYAFAQGPLTLDDPALKTTGRVHLGCRLEEEFFNVYSKDGKITLVLDKNHADFQVAQDVAELVNSQMSFQSSGLALARALNPVSVEVVIPPQYREDPVQFVSQVLSLQMLEPQTGPRVVINERAGSIVISGDVEIGAAVITHKSIVVETGNATPTPKFVSLDPAEASTARLKALVEALNSLKVPTADIIEVIKGLDRNGKLHAPLIVE